MKNCANYIAIFHESSRTMVVIICQFPPSLTKIHESAQVNLLGFYHINAVAFKSLCSPFAQIYCRTGYVCVEKILAKAIVGYL